MVELVVEASERDVTASEPAAVLDACGLACPLPLLKAKKALREIAIGETLAIMATDSGSWRDFAAFAKQSGHTLLAATETAGQYHYVLRRNV